jgi:5-dehydro-2-deoxygluconokinase
MGRAAVDLYGEQVGCALEDVSTFAKYLGGSPANAAVGASRLGIKAAMVTRVGDEPNGQFVRAALEREGVDVSQVSTDPNRLTALVFLAIRGPDDFPHVFYRERCADMALAAAHVDARFIASCGALLVSGTHLSQEGTREACEKAIAAARSAGRKVILDIDYRPVLWGLGRHGEGAARYVASESVSAAIQPLLRDCQLVIGTEEEIRIAGGTADTLAALRIIRSRTRALIVLKLGSQGCIAFEGAIPERLEQGFVAPGFPVEVFNTLGAGDAFMAGFLRGWLRDEPLERCCRYANACGAIVVSRHGCSPAMPTWVELEHFLAAGVKTPRLREDTDLERVHRATTRRRIADHLQILAFDHRGHFEVLGRTHGADAARIAAFKALVADAFEQVARGHPGAGVVLDDRYGADILARLTGRGHWIARAVEIPNTVPLAFEAGANVGLALRTWPAEHVVKCLVYFSAEDPEALRHAQLASLAILAGACAVTNRELLIEVILPPHALAELLAIPRAMEAMYASGIRPDWWKLPPSPHRETWARVHEVIRREDPHCRGALVLGMESGLEELRDGFAAAASCPIVRGFAVGRSIFAHAAADWFAGLIDDAQVVAAVATRYEEVIALWEAAQHGLSGATATPLKEKA